MNRQSKMSPNLRCEMGLMITLHPHTAAEEILKMTRWTRFSKCNEYEERARSYARVSLFEE